VRVLAAMMYDAVASAVTAPPWRPDPKPPTYKISKTLGADDSHFTTVSAFSI